jgi:hypothetical protein
MANEVETTLDLFVSNSGKSTSPASMRTIRGMFSILCACRPRRSTTPAFSLWTAMTRGARGMAGGAGPMGYFSRWGPERQVNHSLHGAGRQRLFAGLARLVARQPFDALRHEPGLPSPHHGLGFA